MIPVARYLREMNHNVFIGSGEEHLSLFRNELTGLNYINFPGFSPGYSKILPQYVSLLFKLPSLVWHIIREHHRLKKIIKEKSIDIVISDNRFGLWNRTITSVYITHMPLIPLPKFFKFLEPLGILLHRLIIKKYSLCFIPDLPGNLNLTGRLTHDVLLPDNTRFIGILSKFINLENSQIENIVKSNHNTVILSGPEPQKGILKLKLIRFLKDAKPETIMFEGKPSKGGEITRIGNITLYSHLPASRMKEIIEESDNIITRSGYSTIMELASLNRSALIIPTPGQTEQEYLAEYLSGKGWFSTMSQVEIDGGISLHTEDELIPAEINRQSSLLFSEALKELLEIQHKKR
jgi:hypothetical protein